MRSSNYTSESKFVGGGEEAQAVLKAMSKNKTRGKKAGKINHIRKKYRKGRG